LEWLKNSFTNYYPDIIYISGNPYINSSVAINGFDAKNHFYKVVDVWRSGWSEKLGTVHPREINKATLRYYLKYPEKRFIIHYLQPHAPYLSPKFRAKGYPSPNLEKSEILAGIMGHGQFNRYFESLVNIMGTILYKLDLIESSWKLRERLGLPPRSPMEAARRRFGIEGLRKAYRENLYIVLKYASKLCKHFLKRKRIIITSDHGELLGEEGTYEHPNGPIEKILNNLFNKRRIILQEVPWFKVKRVIGRTIHT